jgi:CPA2 family monovalent cation:H+ antiporter-2
MFGVGLHFSLDDLARVRRVVVPGALLQTLATTSLGAAIARTWGWTWGGAIVLGLSIGVASTVVLIKSLERRDQLDSAEGRLAVGWLVVEDVTMVFALVLLAAVAPLLSGTVSAGSSWLSLLLPVVVAIAKVLGFVGLMFVVGRRLIPWLLERVARLGSRELFTLAVLACALGIGTIATELFGVSFALGAFFAGAVISESELSHRAAADALPMQDAFAVLFFVSVGMLFDPQVLVRQPLHVLTLAAVIIGWKSVLAFGLLRLFGQPAGLAASVGAALGQIGEFSFIVAGLGVALGLIDTEAAGLIDAAAIIAITLNGPLLWAATRLSATKRAGPSAATTATAPTATSPASSPRVIIVGYGRVGTTVGEALMRAAVPFVVVEEQERIVGALRKRGELAVQGDSTRADVLERANIRDAKLLVVTAPEPFRARRTVDVARQANPRLNVAVRTHSAAEQAYFVGSLTAHGAAGRSVYAEREAALSLAHYALLSVGKTDDEADSLVDGMRRQATGPTETFKALQTQEFQTLSQGR